MEKSVKVLKNAAKTMKVPAEEVLSAFSVIEKAKIDPSAFLETLGGLDSPEKIERRPLFPSYGGSEVRCCWKED